MPFVLRDGSGDQKRPDGKYGYKKYVSHACV